MHALSALQRRGPDCRFGVPQFHALLQDVHRFYIPSRKGQWFLRASHSVRSAGLIAYLRVRCAQATKSFASMNEAKQQRFDRFCAQARADPRAHHNSLQSLLITPIQRCARTHTHRLPSDTPTMSRSVPRYRLLLEQLVARSDPTNPGTSHACSLSWGFSLTARVVCAGYGELKQALTIVQGVGAHINETVRRAAPLNAPCTASRVSHARRSCTGASGRMSWRRCRRSLSAPWS
jgi:hypothetical protein